jgi:putative FmdB family regulatory protein
MTRLTISEGHYPNDVDEQREDLMPLYSYNCQNCNADFELLVRSSDIPACPSCGSEKLQQQVARVCTEIKYPTIAKSGRQAAARGGDLSNFSKQELQTK